MIMLFLHTSFYIDNKIRNGRYLLKFSRLKKKVYLRGVLVMKKVYLRGVLVMPLSVPRRHKRESGVNPEQYPLL